MEKVVALILFLAIGGSMGMSPLSFCNLEKCTNPLPDEDILDNLPPSPEKLEEYCPPFVKTIHCIAEVVFACTGRPIIEWAGSDNETIAEIAQLFMSAGDLIIDLCDEDSNLHKGYVDGVSCFTDKIEDIAEGCLEEGYRMYLEFKFPSIELDDDEEGECMVTGYAVACAAMKLRDACSDETAITFLELVRRSKILKYGTCSPKDVATLRTKFLDFLEEQGGSRDLFTIAFDFRRK